MNFEKLIEQLNEITAKLEDKNTSLDDAFKLFDEGIKISTLCANLLDEYSNKLQDLRVEWIELQKRIDNDDRV